MSITTITAGQISRSLSVAPAAVVTISPQGGATAIVEYTRDSAANIRNGSAKFQPWPKGQVTQSATEMANNAIHLRVTALGGTVVINVDDSVNSDAQIAQRADWGPRAFVRYGPTGNVVGLVAPDGSTISAGGGVAAITGTYAVGQTLAATYPTGTIGTIQFTRTLVAAPFTKTAISGAVATAVNSLSYTLQSADAGYSIGVDCSNQVSSGAGGVVVAGASTTKVLTQSQSPYTMLASDSGMTLAPTVSAPFQILVPAGLGASFACTIAPTGQDYSTELIKSGSVSVKNNTYEIDNANNMANRMLLPGDSGAVAASAADVIALTGTNWRRWLVVASGTGLSDNAVNSLLQARGRTPHEVRGRDGDVLRSIKVGFVNAFNFLETVNNVQMQFSCMIESTPGDISTRQMCMWGGVDTLTKAASDKALTFSDELILNRQITSSSSSPAYFMSDAWNGSASGGTYGCQTGKGGGLLADRGETLQITATAGTTLKPTLATAIPTSDQGINNTTQGSLSRFSPAAIIGLMRDGWQATALMPSSRHQPSNGDRPTAGGTGFRGELGRALGRRALPMMNISIASAGLSHINDATYGTERCKLLAYVTEGALGDIQNDLNFYTQNLTSLRAGLTTLKSKPQFAGKPLDGFTTSPWTLSSDGFTTVAGQTAGGTTAQNTFIETYNNAGAAGTITEYRRFYDMRSLQAVAVSSSLSVWPVAPGARTVADIVTTIGSNIVSSATAAFTSADTGYMLAIPNYNGSGIFVGRMTYIDATHVSLVGRMSGNANNASVTALTAGAGYVRGYYSTTDGTHMSSDYGTVYEAGAPALMA